MQLTKHFHLNEFHCKDGTKVPSEYIPNVQKLCNNLEILRAYLTDELAKKGIKNEALIHINSGYRTTAYNKKVGGKPKSKHLIALAGDITCKYFTPKQIFNAILKLIDSKIMVEGGVELYPGFVHYDPRGIKARW